MKIKKSSLMLGLSLAGSLSMADLQAAPATIFTEDFELFGNAATNLTDTADANPVHPEITIPDDNPAGGANGSGVQVVNWTAKSGSQSLLVRSGSEALVHLPRTRSGSRIQLDFDIQVVKAAGDRGFYVIVRSMGSDTNAEDFMAYRSDRAVGNAIFYYDGIGAAGSWQNATAQHIENQWQHHRFVFNMRTLKFDLFIDDMTTPVVQGGDLSRSGAAVPTSIVLRHEGNSADDGYYAIDNLSLTVEDSRDLSVAFTEGFEPYAANTSGGTDDANPQGPWITNEADGTGDGKVLNPVKVQVVDSSVVAPRSGQKSLKIEGGQRAGVSFAWGPSPEQDVQITWWARVPASVQGVQANYLRMSLYGMEGGRTDGTGDAALLGYGSRDGTIGDATSLTIFTTGWQDTQFDYTPDTWEEYRLITHVAQGTYSIIKSPSSANPVTIVDRAPFIGAAANWGPMFMAAWSSSNGTGHPPVYIDDIEVKAVTTNPEPLPEPYTPTINGTRYTNVTALKIAGPVGDMAVDPRDNSTIYFAIDAAAGAIFRARKTGGTWDVDGQPLASGLDRPSGLVIDHEGTLWWTHDFTMRLMRLKAPYTNQTPEVVIQNFGDTATDDDPIDLAIAPSTFIVNGVTNMIVVADRGHEGDANNALYLVEPSTVEINHTNYTTFLVPPTASALGGGNLNAITPLPQSGEVVLINQDGYIVAVDSQGQIRPINPTVLYTDLSVDAAPNAVAVDPTDGRIWIADDLLDQVWSVSSSATAQEADRLELSFPLIAGGRPDTGIDFHDPGMTFAPDGSFLVLSDTSVVNGGGRLLIFHNEEASAIQPFDITAIARTGSGIELQWESAGAANYVVQRATEITGTFQDVPGTVTGNRFTDPNPPAGQAFYRVVARP